MDRNQWLLEQYLSGAITPEHKAELEGRALEDNQLREEVDRQAALEKILANPENFAFRTGFERRVMARLQQPEQDPWLELSNWLTSFFPRVAIPSIALSALLMFNNSITATGDVVTIEAMFGLPDTSTTAEIAMLGVAE
jgi:hypothetical protein